MYLNNFRKNANPISVKESRESENKFSDTSFVFLKLPFQILQTKPHKTSKKEGTLLKKREYKYA